MAPLKLYYDLRSQPARACFWAVYANDSADKVDFINIDLGKGETRTPEFLAMNPYHTVPTLKDEENGLVLYESGAILQYLAEKLNWTKITIPKDDVVVRAKVGHVTGRIRTLQQRHQHMNAITHMFSLLRFRPSTTSTFTTVMSTVICPRMSSPPSPSPSSPPALL